MEKIRVLIADDKLLYRSLIAEMLNPAQTTLVGFAENGKQVLSQLRQHKTDILLLDLEMPEMDGNKAFEHICTHFPGVKVIILSYYDERILVEHYIRRGARGYISKDQLDATALEMVLEMVHNGNIYKPSLDYYQEKLYTLRQQDIIPLIMEGHTNEEIADDLHITKRAVEKQRQKIYQRSGAERAAHFYKYAFGKGLQFLGKLQSTIATRRGKKAKG